MKDILPENVNKIIVRCPNWVGDIVMATPFLDCLCANFPNASMTGIVRRYAQGVIQDGPWFKQIIDGNDKSIGGLYQVVRNIRQIKPDLALLLPNSFRSALTLWLGGTKASMVTAEMAGLFFYRGAPGQNARISRFCPFP